MQTLTLNTNIHCDSCIRKVGPVLDGHPGIRDWQVDTAHPDKPLTVTGSITRPNLVALIAAAGYTAGNAAGTRSAGTRSAATPSPRFWRDAKVWKRASFNTLNCLIGCSIGDFAMIIYIQYAHAHLSMSVQMALSVIAGLISSILLETLLLRYRESFSWPGAFRTAISMSFLSMVAMELAMNTVDFLITGGMRNFHSPMYWAAFGLAAVAGFLVPLPYNYYQLKKHGKACH